MTQTFKTKRDYKILIFSIIISISLYLIAQNNITRESLRNETISKLYNNWRNDEGNNANYQEENDKLYEIRKDFDNLNGNLQMEFSNILILICLIIYIYSISHAIKENNTVRIFILLSLAISFYLVFEFIDNQAMPSYNKNYLGALIPLLPLVLANVIIGQKINITNEIIQNKEIEFNKKTSSLKNIFKSGLITEEDYKFKLRNLHLEKIENENFKHTELAKMYDAYLNKVVAIEEFNKLKNEIFEKEITKRIEKELS